MSNRHQELASQEQMAFDDDIVYSRATFTGKETSNPFYLAGCLNLSRLTTTLNRLERSIQIGINKVSSPIELI
ncbi:hypothetical protein Tco_0725121 [Tanacetum coccineum]|uniref:Uncharacterized protein n=1 Tax=Tanacetum coccineum TaxID=301880 RepID=A0ABQ4YBZ4_9ASTR